MNFSSFNFDARIQANIDRAGFVEATPIQAKAIGPVLEGHDVLGLAQTGTGKTAAFLLPLYQRLLSGSRCVPRVLVLSPTRELAEQTRRSADLLGKGTGIRSIAIYGGVSTAAQIRNLRRDMPEVLIACPGRLLDLMGQKVIDLSTIESIVLDEADQMLDMGFLPPIRKIIHATGEHHQTLLFSATLPPAIRALAREFQQQPVRIELSASRPVETVRHYVVHVGQTDKFGRLATMLQSPEKRRTLVFTRTKHRARKLAMQLSDAGLRATSIQGDLSQAQRDRAMQQFRSGRADILVATDIAARGIDISQITHVINFDMPDTPEAYTHRIGRTGRMHRQGIALTFAAPEDRSMLRRIEQIIGSPLQPACLPVTAESMVKGQ